jgi:peptide/nickel transport system substrate-binding protein
MNHFRLRPGASAGRVVTGALTAMLMLGGAAVAQQQSPMLDEAVASGALPPVAERLPKNPLVVTPVESVGSSGGTWRCAAVSTMPGSAGP